MLHIDGSTGEGGGQVLRSSLALAILTGQAVHLTNIRAGRAKPGLQPQHLESVKAAHNLRRTVHGAALNSQQLLFEPGEVHAGRYRFDIGTAGATSLVLQTIFLPLARAGAQFQRHHHRWDARAAQPVLSLPGTPVAAGAAIVRLLGQAVARTGRVLSGGRRRNPGPDPPGRDDPAAAVNEAR